MKHPVDDNIARNLQARIHDGDRHALTLLYCELRFIAAILCKAYLAKRGQRLPLERVDAIAHDAATVLMTRYLKDSAYTVRNFRAALYLEVLHLITGGHHKTVPTEEVTEAAEGHAPVQDEDPRDFVHDLLAEHKAGPRVVFDLARSKSYREAVCRIAEYTGRQWIRDRARKLVKVYETLRVEP